MHADDELCLCFHVTRRKVWNYIRRERPRRPSQLSECHGAGTGCGWCRPFLEKLLQDYLAEKPFPEEPPLSPDEYARKRTTYVKSGKGTPPPGATPLLEE